LQLSTTGSKSHRAVLISAGFIDAHARTCLPESPGTYGFPFGEQARFQVALGPRDETPCAPFASPTSALWSSCESVRTESSCLAPAADPLLVFSPLW